MSSLPIHDMEKADGFQDWEVLSSPSSADDSVIVLGTADDIRSDYIDLDSKKPKPPSLSSSSEEEEEEVSEEGGIDSDNPSWEDPGSDSDRGAERMEEYPNSDGETKVTDVQVSSGDGGVWKDSSFAAIGGSRGADEMERDEVREFCSGGTEEMVGECAEGDDLGIRGSCGEETRGVVWWRMPFQLLKLCFVKGKPVWSITVAAAVVGFVMLGRRLYRTRHKSRSGPFRIAVNDKGSSEFTIRAARLNEALSTVRRVPVIRTYPAAGASQWPVVSLR